MADDTTPVDEKPGETPPEEVTDAAESGDKEQKLVEKAVAAARAVAKEVVETILGAEGEDDEPAPKAKPAGQTGVEDDLEGKVRTALEGIGVKTAEEDRAAISDHDDRLKKLEDAVANAGKPEPERAPATGSWLSRKLWGS